MYINIKIERKSMYKYIHLMHVCHVFMLKNFNVFTLIS